MNQSKEVINATLMMYKECITTASRGIVRNWKILPGIIGLYYATMYIGATLGRLGQVGGFIMGFVICGFISLFYTWIAVTVRGKKLEWSDLVEIDIEQFWTIMSVGFILWIVNYFLRAMPPGENAFQFQFLINVGMGIVFNAIPEVIYQKGARSTHAFSETLKFIQVNWIEWFLPFILIMLPWLFSGFSAMLLLSSVVMVTTLLPTVSLVFLFGYLVPGLMDPIGQVLGVIFATWFMIFRGKLFEELDGGTRRRRIFLAKQK